MQIFDKLWKKSQQSHCVSIHKKPAFRSAKAYEWPFNVVTDAAKNWGFFIYWNVLVKHLEISTDLTREVDIPNISYYHDDLNEEESLNEWMKQHRLQTN